MAAVEASSFRFGVELEFLVVVRKKKYNTWDYVAKKLGKWLSEAGVRNRVDAAGQYDKWAIVQELTARGGDTGASE